MNQVPIRIPAHITAEQFGCDKDTFERDVRGQYLRVSHVSPPDAPGEHFVYVFVGKDPEPYGVAVSDLLEKGKEEPVEQAR